LEIYQPRIPAWIDKNVGLFMKIVVANTQSVARPHKRKQLIKEITRELGDKVKRLAFSPPANQLALTRNRK
jgi:hypothetical protein